MTGHAQDHHHQDGHRDPPNFPIQEGRAIWGFLLAFLAYWLSHRFVYVENDPGALARASARGERVEWSSFDKFYKQAPTLFLQPSNHEELIGILREAAASNQTVKVVGSGHSWTPIGLTDGVMLNLDKFNKVLSIDASAKTVTVQAGIRIRDLSAALAAHDPPLALRNTGVLDRQSLAGALATGTHGTGIRYKIMSADVVALELVTAGGNVLRGSRRDPDPAMRDMFEAAVLHLGALGVLTEVSMEVVEAFSVIKRNRLLPLNTVLSTLPALAAGVDHLLVWFIPYTGRAQLMESLRIPPTKVPPTHDWGDSRKHCQNSGSTSGDEASAAQSGSLMLSLTYNKVVASLRSFSASLLLASRPWLGVLQLRLLSAAGSFSSLFPVTYVPFWNRQVVAPALHLFAWGESFYPHGHRGIVLDDHPDCYREAEWFLPLESFNAAMTAFLTFLDSRRGKIGANFVVQIRVTHADDLWLSPFRREQGPQNNSHDNTGQDKTMSDSISWFVSVATLVKGFDSDPYLRAAEREVWIPNGGRPHWGKLHYLAYHELSALYGEPFEKYLRVRRRLDPQDMFMNSHLRELFFERAVR